MVKDKVLQDYLPSNLISYHWPLMWGLPHWSPVDSLYKGPVMQNSDGFFVVIRNKLLNKQSSFQWFEMFQCSCHIIGIEQGVRHCLQNGSLGDISLKKIPFKIQMWGKFHFAFIQILMKCSLQNFAPDMTAVLSWHVLNFVVIWSPAIELQLSEFSSNLNCDDKIVQWVSDSDPEWPALVSFWVGTDP